MRDLLLHKTKEFLEFHHHQGSPLLLGFSGGPDSSALLYLLSECCRFFPLKVHVAHVDHGWREGSTKEAAGLKKRVESLGFPFHLKKLTSPKNLGNLEEKGRDERLNFFSSIYREEGCQALLLAHQAEDQAETVLKRVLEGASLMHLGGMREVSELDAMVVWRPLLSVSKTKILRWIEEKGIETVHDETNLDPKFLRGRMRSQLFPEMKRRFGKEMVAPLGNVGLSAHELKEYLERKVVPYLRRVEEGPCEVRLDLSEFLPMETVELKALVRLLCKRLGMGLSFDAIELLCKLLNTKASKKKILQKNHAFHAHRGVLTIKSLPQ